MHNRRLASFALCTAGLLAGCSDKPGVLSMSVAPVAESFNSGDAIGLKVLLKSNETVCLSRHYDVDVTIERLGTDEHSIRPERRALCGNAALMLLPLLPVILPARALDVADLGERFIVLKPDNVKVNQLEIGGANTVTDWFDQRWPEVQWPRPRCGSWRPGEYRVTVALQNRNYPPPAPLLWSPYSHPVKAEAIVHIVDSSTQPASLDPTPISAEIVR